MGHKGYYGQYTGNAKWSKNHADTKVTKSNYKASERDDAAHIDYLKRDVDYDNKHGHSDSSMTSDEKHISKLAGDMKYDKEHHGSPAKSVGAHSMKPSKYASHLASASEHKAPSDEVIAKRKKEGKKTTGHISDKQPTNTPPKDGMSRKASPFNHRDKTGKPIQGPKKHSHSTPIDTRNLYYFTDQAKINSKNTDAKKKAKEETKKALIERKNKAKK